MDKMTKHCRWCGTDKPLTEFYASAANTDGRTNKCKTCHRTHMREHQRVKRAAERERIERGEGRYGR